MKAHTPSIVRTASEGDLPALEKLFFEFSKWKLQRTESIRKALRNPNEELLVASSDNQVIAFLHQVFYNDPLHAGPCSSITSLFVKEQYRRKGVASQLLKKALETAKSRNVIETHVTTREDNSTAIEFYGNRDFTRVGILFEINPWDSGSCI